MIVAFVLINLNIGRAVSPSVATVPGVAQDGRIVPQPEQNVDFASDFVISANSRVILGPHHLRRIVVYLAPQAFTLVNVQTMFLHISEEYPSEDFLWIDAVSTTNDLEQKAEWFASIESFPFGDVTSLSCGAGIEQSPLSAHYWRAAPGESIVYCSASGESTAVDLRHLSYGCNGPSDSTPDIVGATISNCKAIVERLLDSGVDPNLRTRQGWGPVFEAAYWHHEEILELLLDRGADINQRSASGWTPLIAAANRDRSLPIVELLLSRGADINARTEEGRTALIYSVLKQNAALARMLLAHGADVNARDGYGKTAIMIAEEGHDENVASLLRKAGARPSNTGK